MTRPQQVEIPVMGRVVGATAGFVFAAIGLTVIGFLCFGDDGFGAPPLVFRIFGSLIGIMFVVGGGSMGLAAALGKPRMLSGGVAPAVVAESIGQSAAGPVVGGAFSCPHCGAALAGKAEASPHGDVKCPFCGAWFNIHGRG